MVFFDLNVPHLEGGGLDKPLADNTNRKNTRLRIVVKAMELGYTGVAYNRSMKGLMSDSDRCTITPFPISSLLKVAPSLSSSVKFHRELLGVPLNSPFRQYTRLTVSIDNMIQANALNSGNPVLKTYDLVAVRPLNQIVFEQACKVSEVDLIAIDFSDKLPFRLKLPMVKAAIERGVYFEITYSHLISDVQARRQMVQNAKLLVDWTRGKNLIFTSAASSVNEIRGPYDVANLSSLLGLSVERAKAAISKNCSSLLSRALRKKQFYKEAVRVERVSSSTQLDSKEPWFADCPSWDHISSGDGDLMFDDIAKFFSESSKEPKTSKSIDFASIAKELPSNGMKLKDWLPVGGEKLQPPNASSCLPAAEPGGSDEVKKGLKQSNEPEVVTVAGPMSLFSNPLKNQNSSYRGFVEPRNDTSKVYTDAKEIETTSSFCEEPMSSNKLDAVSVAGGITLHDMSSQECVLNREGNLTFPDDVAAETSSMCNVDSEGSSRFDLVSSSKGFLSTTECDLVSPMDTFEQSVPSKDNELPSRDEDSGSLDNPDTVLGADYVNMGKCLTETEDREQIHSVSTACDMSIDTYLINGQPKDSQFLLADDKLLGDSRSGMQGDVALTADAGAPEVPSVEIEEETGKEFTEINRQEDDESKSGKARFKHRQKSNRALPFPLKHLLKPVVFKKKSKKSKNRGNKTQLQRNYRSQKQVNYNQLLHGQSLRQHKTDNSEFRSLFEVKKDANIESSGILASTYLSRHPHS